MHSLLLLALIASASATDRYGSELFNGNDDLSSTKGGLTCTESSLRDALNKANYYTTPCSSECGPCDGRRQLDSDNSNTDDTDWDAINSGICANDDIEILCAKSVWARGFLDTIEYAIENRDAVLCCWQLGYPPEAYIFFSRRRQLETEPGKNRRPSYTMVKSDSLEHTKLSERSLEAATLETSSKSFHDMVAKMVRGSPKSAKLLASARALGASFKGEQIERRLQDSDTSSDSDDMTESSDPDGPMDAFAVPKGYDCNNYWQVRADLLSVFDTSPWLKESVCGVGDGDEQIYPYLCTNTNQSTCPEQYGDESRCRALPVFTIDGFTIGTPTLCFAGIFIRRDLSWTFAQLGDGPAQCCLQYWFELD